MGWKNEALEAKFINGLGERFPNHGNHEMVLAKMAQKNLFPCESWHFVLLIINWKRTVDC